MRFYGIDLARHLGTDRLTWRRLDVLIAYLPRDSATVREVHGEKVAWGPTEHLLASAVDLLAAGVWQRGGDKKAKRPQPVPRPGEADAKRERAQQVHDRLIAQRERLNKRRR